MIRGKCPVIGRVVTSGSPEARRKGLDCRLEISYVVKGPAKPLALFTFSRSEYNKIERDSGLGGF